MNELCMIIKKFPMWVSEKEKYVDDGIFFGRYRKGKIQL